MIAILLSTLMLIQSLGVDYDDFIQLDELIEHAQFHKAEYGDNFFVFISKHYGDLKQDHTEKNQEEKQDHEQLPFQCFDHLVTSTAFLMSQNNLDIETIELSEFNDSRFHYLLSFSTLHKQGLLQPPKFA